MTNRTVLITGANRGIGLELCRQFLAKGDRVIALCRQSSSALQGLAAEVYEDVDVTSLDSLRATQQALQDVLDEHGIDVLINNAGIMRDEIFGKLDEPAFTTMREQFEVNALAPLKVAQVFAYDMSHAGKIIMMTSRMGSIADNDSGGRYGYRMSKAALNMAASSLAVDLKPQGVALGIIHPGFVQTDMTGHNGFLTPAQAAEAIAERIEGVSLDNTGTFWHSNGEILPW